MCKYIFSRRSRFGFWKFWFFHLLCGSGKVKKWSKMTQIAKHFYDQRLLLNKTSNHDIWCTGVSLTSMEGFLKFWKLLFIPYSVGIKKSKHCPKLHISSHHRYIPNETPSNYDFWYILAQKDKKLSKMRYSVSPEIYAQQNNHQ